MHVCVCDVKSDMDYVDGLVYVFVCVCVCVVCVCVWCVCVCVCVFVCVQKELVAEEINHVQLSLRDSEAILVSPFVYTYACIWEWTKIWYAMSLTLKQVPNTLVHQISRCI